MQSRQHSWLQEPVTHTAASMGLPWRELTWEAAGHDIKSERCYQLHVYFCILSFHGLLHMDFETSLLATGSEDGGDMQVSTFPHWDGRLSGTAGFSGTSKSKVADA